MIFAMLFAFWRFLQIITLLPTMGMLAWFVDGYVKNNQLTPNYILVLFIVSTLALAWALVSLFSYHRSSANGMLVAVVDLLFVGAFIAAVWFLRGIGYVDCTNVRRDTNWQVTFGGLGSVSGPDWDINTDKPCAMLKASWVFGIMNCVFFFITSVLAFMHRDRMSADYDRKYYRGGHHHSHHHRARSGSHHSRRSSSYSHRRVYV